MQLTVENFRGIKHASLKLSSGITLIAGQNGSGKTSIIQALQCLVTGETLPISGLKKKDAKALVNDSDKSGRAMLDWCTEGETEIKWPSCKVTGPSFKCSPYAAGFALPATIPAKDLTEILGVLPTKEEFLAEVPTLDTDLSEKIWETVTTVGWDNAHSQSITSGRDLKRDWEKLSGENWGVEKAVAWAPVDFVDKSIYELQTGLLSAEKMYHHAIKSEAFDEKEKQELEKLASELDDAKAKIKGINTMISSNWEELTKAQSLLQELPGILNEQQGYECWKCGTYGVLLNGTLIEAPDTRKTEQDVTAARQRVDEQEKIIEGFKTLHGDLNVSLRLADTKLASCQDAKKKLSMVVLDTPAPGLSSADARAEVELCRRRLHAYKIKQECDEIREALGMNSYISSVLNPDGLRKQVLSAKLASFNELLSVVCEIAETWPLIELDESLEVRLDDRPYVLLSKGEQFAVNAGLQIALTKLDKSKIVIIDGADILDSKLRSGLFNILENIPIPSVVGCTANSASDLVVLEEPGYQYWCQDSSIVSLTLEAASRR